MSRRAMGICCGMPILLVAGGFVGVAGAQQQAARPSSPAVSRGRTVVDQFVDRYCLDCHNSEAKTAGLDLDTLGAEYVIRHPEAWEEVVRKLVARQMPPAKRPRPEERTYESVVSTLERLLDDAAAEHPDPGRT